MSSAFLGYHDDEVHEETAIVHFRDLQRCWLALFNNHASNMSSTMPLLDALPVAVWSHVLFDEILLGHRWVGHLRCSSVDFLLLTSRGMGHWTLSCIVCLQEHGQNETLDQHLTIGLLYDFKNDCLLPMPLAVACLGFILLFTIIFFNSLVCAFIYVTGRYIYDGLYPEHRWTCNEDEGIMTSTKDSLIARHYTTVYLILDTMRSRIKGKTSTIHRMLRRSLLRSRTTRTWTWTFLCPVS
ncbi:uncharacterized protein LACBIDRAFT_299119 [Laccaria bicolor S238N-H82]|uniref:Predicted protein n=1 Tax=Laccaria bicolor (strain S238N-H82 / ATCC MYA-4686) TaxID=486041 RepID=B0DE35_LACBS|nr:uncharacterized protein LACBIDRAFT_299119 [Laccaria bicolor S238N-H82]EDR07319.1 predicted protein [Laccaria bicolor S238N-H82]|eukprot:XP_001882250.1 predicted protein [Laccaria bicolor S238N-H82]